MRLWSTRPRKRAGRSTFVVEICEPRALLRCELRWLDDGVGFGVVIFIENRRGRKRLQSKARLEVKGEFGPAAGGPENNNQSVGQQVLPIDLPDERFHALLNEAPIDFRPGR